jgi:drug/metabolite transporter (DMT)-like permease
MGVMQQTRMPAQTASAVTFFYALGYPIGKLAVGAMTPMAVLVFRFALAGLLLAVWAAASHVAWPRGRKLGHVAVTGLLIQAVQFCCIYLAVERGAPAVLCAVVIAMNPVATAVLGSLFLRDRLALPRIIALVVGVLAVLAACASRLTNEHGVDPVLVLLLVALLGLSAGGVYQQRFCADVDFRASAAIQHIVALAPAAVLAAITPFVVHDRVDAVVAVAAVVVLNAGVGVSLYVRAINKHGAAAVAMLFCLIPAVAGLLSWLMLGERPDAGIGIGLVLGAVACWLNARASPLKPTASGQSTWRRPRAAPNRGDP